MSLTTRQIPILNRFYLKIRIQPHTATLAEYIDRPVTLKEFAKHREITLEEVQETGELIARCGDEFIHGTKL